MSFVTIPPEDVDQGSPIDEQLMAGGVKNDLDDLNSRTANLEALSGSGGITVAAVEDLFADIVSGGEDDVAKFWKVRHHVMMSATGQGQPRDGLDYEAESVYSRFMFDPNNTIVSAMASNVQSYLSNVYLVEQNEQLKFKIKRGENFFCIGSYLAAANATVFRVYVDNVNVNTLGLTDENGQIVANSFSVNNATTAYGKLFHFYGLDGEDHIVTIKNENATALEVPVNFVDVGFRSKEYAIDHTIRIKAGTANVGGIAAKWGDGAYSFSKPGIGFGNGHTGMLKINQSGTITAVDGLSPAKTEMKPQSTVAFSGAVTNLKVKNHYYMPSYGIAMYQSNMGVPHMFSYSSKIQPGGPATQALDGIIWEKQPSDDFTPLQDPSALAVNTLRGDGRIEYWAKPTIQIGLGNNKIDFSITIDGVTTTHVATIGSGWYSADLVRIGAAVVNAMTAAKPLPVNHRYFMTYSQRAQLWSIGVEGTRVSRLDFLFVTGVNSASSFGSTIGFAGDCTSFTSYQAPLVKQHSAIKVYVADDNVRPSEHQSIKYGSDAGLHESIAEADSIMVAAGLPGYRRFNTSSNIGFITIYPDEDCCGMTLMFMREDVGTHITYQVDGGDETYLVNCARPNDAANPTYGALIHCFVSFPKGSRKITLKAEINVWFMIESSTVYTTFFGYRQHFTKPQWETLAPQEKVLKTYEINPIRMFATEYGNISALYTPQASNDNIDTITESGVWTQVATTTVFARAWRQTVVAGAYVDVQFTLAGDGGGIGIRRTETTATTRRMAFYLASGAIGSIVEATDMIEFASTDWISTIYKKDFQHLGLPAGTYTLRMKQLDTQAMVQNAIIIYDTIPPQNPMPKVMSDVTNTGQSLTYPIHTRKREMSRYQSFRQPSYYAEGTYKRGIVHHGDYQVAAHSVLLFDEAANVVQYQDHHWMSMLMTNVGEYAGYRTFCRSMTALCSMFSTYSTSVTPSVDGRNLNNVSMASEIKGGLAPSATRGDTTAAAVMNFEWACTFSSGLIYNITDTRGITAGQKALLVDNTGATEEVFIDQFTTDATFTIAKALSVLTPANVVKVQFWGFHNMKLLANDALDWYVSGFAYEPLPIEESLLPIRVQTERREETLYARPVVASVAAVTSTRVSARVPFPIHSDGEEGNFFSAQWMDVNTEAISYVTVATLHFNPFLRSIISASGVATTGRTFAIISRKWIKAISDLRVRG